MKWRAIMTPWGFAFFVVGIFIVYAVKSLFIAEESEWSHGRTLISPEEQQDGTTHYSLYDLYWPKPVPAEGELRVWKLAIPKNIYVNLPEKNNAHKKKRSSKKRTNIKGAVHLRGNNAPNERINMALNIPEMTFVTVEQNKKLLDEKNRKLEAEGKSIERWGGVYPMQVGMIL